MNKKIIYVLYIILFFSCKSKITANTNLIDELKSINKDFTIVFWKDKIDSNINPVGFMQKDINNDFLFDTGVGFANCEMLEMKQISNDEIFIKIKGTSCIKFQKQSKDVDPPPDCARWEICVIEYKLTIKQINELKNKQTSKINLVGKIISKEVKDKIQ